ncbi:benzoate 4-monooxygenase cytochrome P450 [Hypoxylon sp. NC0597]|nr:benzoate 4-monooxygenase cytochrome P450 [Hypoxylon sp. NC0597]
MFRPSLSSLSWTNWVQVSMSLVIILAITRVVYNIFLHPLNKVPGPFWARASGIPSWYHAYTGKRHIWLWQLFQTYGDVVRPAPNVVVFCNPKADEAIYSNSSNVRRSHFYKALKRKGDENMPLNIVDVAEHAARRKLLNQAFTDTSVRAVAPLIVKHVDRLHQIILEDNDGSKDWTAPLDLSASIDGLMFDILGDLCFGKSFDMKEPGDNPMKAIPHTIAEYMRFYYPFCQSPFLSLLLWLKPRGLDWLFDVIAPPLVERYNRFVYDTISNRIALQKQQEHRPEEERRRDIFHFLYEAHKPDAGSSAYDEGDLRADISLLIIAGSDTTSVALSSFFFYVSGDPERCQKLTDEILATFDSVEDIVQGAKLTGCTYLRACIDEVLRLAPAIPCELQREVLQGGIEIMGQHYVAGTIVGTAPWTTGRNEKVYGDPWVFRPERWIADGVTVTREEVTRLKANFRPFSSGPGVCVGKNVALMEIMITVARTLHRFELRRAPKPVHSTENIDLRLGGRDKNQFQIEDAYISLVKGPDVQFRKRQPASV